MKKSDEWIRYDPEDAPPWTPPPFDPFYATSPKELFEHGMATPEQYLSRQTERTRDIVHWAVKNHPGLTIADALEGYGGLAACEVQLEYLFGVQSAVPQQRGGDQLNPCRFSSHQSIGGKLEAADLSFNA
jgi:hypothetical protein